jgi:hypothetical protein
MGPAWQRDDKTFTVDTAQNAETPSKIKDVYGVWPRPGQA